MNKKDLQSCELYLEQKYSTCGIEMSNQVVIETDHIYIKHKGLGFTIDVGIEEIEELHRIIINGVSFVREN